MNLQNAAITRMIQLGSVAKYESILKRDLFDSTNAELIETLIKYEREFSICMDEATFKQNYDFFTWTPTDYQVEFLVDELRETKTEAVVRKLVEDSGAILGDAPTQVTRDLLTELQKLVGQYDLSTTPIDLVRRTTQRLAHYRVHYAQGVTMGFKHLDEYSNGGTQPGEIEIWCARPGNCKTFVLLWSAYQGFLQGKKVSFISPEMTELEMGLRLDAIMFNVSQRALISGRADESLFQSVQEAIVAAQVETGGVAGQLNFHDAFTRGRRFTTADIERIIERDESDIVVIDGLMLIDPLKVNEYSKNETLGNLMSEMRKLTSRTQVPLRLAHQASRKADQNFTGKRRKDITPVDMIPELDHLAESGATEQFANRVVCLKYDPDGRRLYMAIRKNRNGPLGKPVYSFVDLDVGSFRESVEYEPDEETTGAEVETPESFF